VEPWQAVVLGLVEGITEYLPVSSTGHLILASEWTGLAEGAHKPALDAFNIAIQGGAIAAVLGLYRERVWSMAQGLLGRDPAGLRLLVNVAVAFLPAAVLGPLLGDLIERHLFRVGPVLFALAAGGAWMIWLDRRGAPRGSLGLERLYPRRALAIGLLQCVAMWPGTSRSMMAIAGGVLLGLRARDAAEFSFLLGVPTLGGACAYKLAQNLLRAAQGGGPNLFEQLGPAAVAIGFAVAAASAAVAVRWLVGFLARHGLAAFGWYRIGLAAGLFLLWSIGWVDLHGAP
jgi:undecaprenyl-diphosphatase